MALRFIGDFKELEKFGFERLENKVFFSDYFRGWKKYFRKYTDYKIDGLDERLLEETTITIHEKDSVGYKGEICICTTDTCTIQSLKTPQVMVYDEALEFLYDLIKAGLIKKTDKTR